MNANRWPLSVNAHRVIGGNGKAVFSSKAYKEKVVMFGYDLI